jgi:integrase
VGPVGTNLALRAFDPLLDLGQVLINQLRPSGMRRSELAGVERSMLDLEQGVLYIEDTRVVVAGRAQSSDGKSEAGSREISLDSFTTEQLRRYVERIDRERAAFGEDYPDHDYLMVGPEGRPLHPDTITARFNRLVDRAGVPKIRLHDVRHTYATLALDNGQNIKLLSQRIGHADTSVTLRVYTHRTTGVDREMADHMGGLISSAVDSLRLRSVPLSVPGHPNPAPESSDGDGDDPPPTPVGVPA